MYEHIIQAAMETPWAILPGKLAIIRQLLDLRASGHKLTPDEVRAQLDAARPGERVTFSGGSGIAVIPVVGTIIPRGNMILESSGAVSTQRLAAQFRAAMADPEVGSVILDVDSPGGQVGGVEELAREMFNARGQKPVTAVANGLAASAAYWIATAADELVVTPSGQVGSIGVFGMHQDISAALANDGVKVTLISAGRYKTEGNPFEPLSDDALKAMQGMIDEYYTLFVNAVARNRGVDAAAVRGGFGEGRVVTAQTAVRLGMADRVATLDEVVSGMQARPRGGQKATRADGDFRARRLRAMSL